MEQKRKVISIAQLKIDFINSVKFFIILLFAMFMSSLAGIGMFALTDNFYSGFLICSGIAIIVFSSLISLEFKKKEDKK